MESDGSEGGGGKENIRKTRLTTDGIRFVGVPSCRVLNLECVGSNVIKELQKENFSDVL